MNRALGRPDLATGAPTGDRSAAELREPTLRNAADARDGPLATAHLGAYAPLVSAIRDELDHFVAGQLRLHLAIAERDRFLLTSIDVEPSEGGDGDELLQRFTREFTPEQIKRFLARDVIAHLPNASALDLTQFGGLNAGRPDVATSESEAYADLLAALRAESPDEGPRTYEVELKGRWIDSEPRAVTSAGEAASPPTPLAGSQLAVRIEDADGPRHVTLTAIVPNRRYVIGKGEGCDIVVTGTFVSRRHCEIWREDGAWWASDAGSTNGIRVETAQGVLGRAGPQARGVEGRAAIEIVPGAQLVLSALTEGQPADHPRVLLEQPRRSDAKMATPLSAPLSAPVRVPTTPTTPIAAPLKRARTLTLTIRMMSGPHSLVLDERKLPLKIGRSRNQDLVVDWVHEGVSGHHVDIVSTDGSSADVEVHGDNGVTVDHVAHAPSTRFRWHAGQSMTLGRASEKEPACMLELSATS